MQIGIVFLIPNYLINEIWYRIRGIKKPSGLTVGTFTKAQV
jgi:hypothetical protein